MHGVAAVGNGVETELELAGRLLRKMVDRSADQWEILSLPAVLEDESSADVYDERRQGGSAWPEKVLWPEFKSAVALDIIRQQDAKTYAALYQQNPTDASTAEWAPEFFGEWLWVQPNKWPTEWKMKIICVDASKGKSDKQGDYCAIVFMGIPRDQELLYVDCIMDRIPLDQIVRKVLGFCDEKKPDMVGIEAEQFQECLCHEFQRQAASRGVIRWPLYQMMTRGFAKVVRIRRLSQYVVNRQLRFKDDSPGCRLLVDQLMDFPQAEHDDGPDALEMCTRLPLEAT